MLQIMRARTLRIKLDEAESRGHRKAIAEITGLVAGKNRIYSGPIELPGDLNDCAVIGGDPAVKMTGSGVSMTKCIVYSGGTGVSLEDKRKDLRQQAMSDVQNALVGAGTRHKEYIKEVLDYLRELDELTVTSWIRHKWPLGKRLFNLG